VQEFLLDRQLLLRSSWGVYSNGSWLEGINSRSPYTDCGGISEWNGSIRSYINRYESEQFSYRKNNLL